MAVHRPTGRANGLNNQESKYVFNYPVHSGVFTWQGALAHSLIARTRVGALERYQRDPYATWDLYAACNGARFGRSCNSAT